MPEDEPGWRVVFEGGFFGCGADGGLGVGRGLGGAGGWGQTYIDSD